MKDPGAAVTGTPILGVFNISTRPLLEIIPILRLSGVIPSAQYIVRAHTTGAVTEPVRPDSPAASLTVSLPVGGWEVFTAYPVMPFHSEELGLVSIANLGLVGKMTGSAAITSNQAILLENGRVFLDTRVKALGVLGVYISSLPKMSIDNEFLATIQGQAIPPDTVSVSKASKYVLEVNVEKAWKDLNLSSGWSNEVEIKLYISIDQ